MPWACLTLGAEKGLGRQSVGCLRKEGMTAQATGFPMFSGDLPFCALQPLRRSLQALTAQLLAPSTVWCFMWPRDINQPSPWDGAAASGVVGPLLYWEDVRTRVQRMEMLSSGPPYSASPASIEARSHWTWQGEESLVKWSQSHSVSGQPTLQFVSCIPIWQSLWSSLWDLKELCCSATTKWQTHVASHVHSTVYNIN